jgi:hypothetical protein
MNNKVKYMLILNVITTVVLLMIISFHLIHPPQKSPPPAKPQTDIGLFISIIECESGGKHTAVGDGGLAINVAQFHRDTFYEMAKMANFRGANIHNPIHQMKLLRWALDHNMGNRWTCYRMLMKQKSDAYKKSITKPSGYYGSRG